MSRGQSTQAFNTASNQNSTSFGNAQSAFGSSEDAIGNYNKQLASFVSGNPYTKGGEYDQTINTGLSNVSDAGANSLAGALQDQARRTGMNSAANAATAAAGAEANTRQLSSDLASAQQTRIGDEASYNKDALSASAEPIQANESLYGTASGAANDELGDEEKAAQTPGFWDQVGGVFSQDLGAGLSGFGSSYGGALGKKL